MANSQYSSTARPLTISFDGGSPLIGTKLTCNEKLFSGCKLLLSVISSEILPKSLLGKTAIAEFKKGDEEKYFSALTTSIELIEYSSEKGIFLYQIECLDPIALLKYKQNQKIFQNQSSQRILEQIFEDAGINNYISFSLSNSGKEHEYCIQLNETDLDFAKRIMSFEGWFYFIEHSNSKPKVIISDTNQTFKDIDQSTVYYKDGSIDSDRIITRWQEKAQLGTAKLLMADHTQELAEVFQSDERKSASDSNLQSLSSYFFGTGAIDKNELRQSAKLQMEALDCSRQISSGHSQICVLTSGSRFSLAKHPVSDLNQEYILTHVIHNIEQSESGRNVQYQNKFHAIPKSIQFRPHSIEKPTVKGLHCATVTGPSGDEVYTDKKGRIKVQFHWDSEGQNDENTSCWLPVSQGLASQNFGLHALPRIGDEVLVQYINGDPDQPVVVGSIYNGANPPPYETATQTGLKTRTTPNGSSSQGNELRFEDQEDKEEVYLHAEKDLLVDINNDSKTEVRGLKSTLVEKTLEVTSKENMSYSTEKEYSVKSAENFSATSDKDLSLTSKGNLSGASDKEVTLDAGSSASLTAKSSIKIDGQSIEISGKTKIELKVGGSKIEIGPSGIKIDAPQVEVSGKAKVDVKAAMVAIEGQGKTDVKGALVSVQGSAMTEIKAGAMVQIQGAIAKLN
ncbi:type VI secretion system tip protein VgrG [Shewanella sp. 202IG2-18]|uniref:type VI secretion system Vgr family protein n=1 Tax=Parashewanella hymeniacidonis TaxID=2807618 RepID=UPI00195F9BC4|nr:type VI secretion system tip protein TssI/VgrG [Parashewanella hymeniacidonis]MBM7071371.1 type VI secretion system tip protein VgrG [Parashewanella hymeniacidonis]